jgi:hypothetical protein
LPHHLLELLLIGGAEQLELLLVRGTEQLKLLLGGSAEQFELQFFLAVQSSQTYGRRRLVEVCQLPHHLLELLLGGGAEQLKLLLGGGVEQLELQFNPAVQRRRFPCDLVHVVLLPLLLLLLLKMIMLVVVLPLLHLPAVLLTAVVQSVLPGRRFERVRVERKIGIACWSCSLQEPKPCCSPWRGWQLGTIPGLAGPANGLLSHPERLPASWLSGREEAGTSLLPKAGSSSARG